jgi:hypothetical protein
MGFGVTRAASAGVVIVLGDLVLLSLGGKTAIADASVPLIMTGVVRIIVVSVVVRGIAAAGRRQALGKTMAAADREYELDRRARDAREPPRGRGGPAFANAEEDEDQG